MAETGTEPVGGTGAGPALDLATLSEAISSILDSSFNEHAQWNQGFLEWCNAQLMNMQPVPPEADRDFINRQNWIIGYIKRFEAVGDMLARAGNRTLADRVDNYVDGLTKLLASFQATKRAMAADDAATQTKVSGIMDKMNAESLAAGAGRMGLQQQAFNQTFEMNSKTMADQRASFERMANKWDEI